MDLIREKTAFYPAFHLGARPMAIECRLSIVQANGKRYLKTPFAMLDAYADDDIERTIDGRGYYASAIDAEKYLKSEYPWAEHSEPIMDALLSARRQCTLVGPGRLADKIGVSVDQLYKIARGHKSFGLKAVRAAVRKIDATR